MALEANRLPESEEILKLEQEHRRYSAQLEALTQKPYLSEEEQLEETRLKKLKLRAKDELTARRSGQTQAYVA
ncbi:YdcH family protein [Silvibacterium sp.]|uniref:YdcH family protein n=1 Tax=Silvibacterium sp. TaxID=1964179 RepID=UPI0039E29F8A